MRAPICLAILAATCCLHGAGLAAEVPFVGCQSDGQVGPQPAPAAPAHTPDLPPRQAARLAWYASAYNAVLAPRGWRCFGLYGSNGAFLLVTPEDRSGKPVDAKLLGPAVEISVSLGETSGRFEAARIAARLFPGRRAFVDRVIAEGFEPAKDFPSGPFPHDRLRRVGPDAVMFETPADREGMGTLGRLVKSAEPIKGLAVMDADNDATLVLVRLPAALRSVAPAIIDTAKTESARISPDRG